MIEKHGPGQFVAKHVYACFHQSPAFLGTVVFSVFAEIPLGPRDGQPFENFRQFHYVKLVQIGFDFVVARTGHWNTVGHAFTLQKQKSGPHPKWGSQLLF